MTTMPLSARVADHLWEFRSTQGDDGDRSRPAGPRPSRSASAEHDRADAERLARAETDEAMVRRLRGGDDHALEYLLRSYGDWLIGVAESVVGSADIAQDVVQEVFMWLWDSRGRLEIRSGVGPYLYRAVRNRAMNAREHERAEQTVRGRLASEGSPYDVTVDASRDPEAVAEAFERAVEQALAALSPKLREVFLLRVDQGWSNAEIAEALGIAVASVHQQMYRATKLLAKHLAPWLDFDR